MSLHGFGPEEGTLTGAGWVLRKTCECGQQFIACAPSLRKAARMIRRRYRDYRGQAMAAGPGWGAE